MLIWFSRVGVVAALLILLWIVWRRAPRVALVIALGTGVRLGLTVSLYLLSAYQVAAFEAYHMGDGFWQQAGDARRYYLTALEALDTGWDVISWDSASPAYTRLLALWLWMLGRSPLIAALLNVAAYVAVMGVLALLVVRSGRFSERLILPFAAVAGAPALIAHGSQALKDEIFAYALVFACIGVSVALTAYRHRRLTRTDGWLLLLGVIGMTIVGGVRFYVAVMFLGLAPLCLFALWAASRFRRPLRWVTVTALTMVSLWVPAVAGLGVWAHPAELIIGPDWKQQSLPDIANLPLRSVERARVGFEKSGGRTNLAANEDGPVVADTTSAEGHPGRSAARPGTRFGDGRTALAVERVVSRLSVGLGAVFLPVSFLKACCGVTVATRPAVLRFADLDSLYAMAMLLATVYVYRRERHLLSGPTAAFVVLLSLTVLVLAAYAVTNYGTLVRLRMIGMVPLWLLPVIALRFDPRQDDTAGAPEGHS